MDCCTQFLMRYSYCCSSVWHLRSVIYLSKVWMLYVCVSYLIFFYILSVAVVLFHFMFKSKSDWHFECECECESVSVCAYFVIIGNIVCLVMMMLVAQWVICFVMFVCYHLCYWQKLLYYFSLSLSLIPYAPVWIFHFLCHHFSSKWRECKENQKMCKDNFCLGCFNVWAFYALHTIRMNCFIEDVGVSGGVGGQSAHTHLHTHTHASKCDILNFQNSHIHICFYS